MALFIRRKKDRGQRAQHATLPRGYGHALPDFMVEVRQGQPRSRGTYQGYESLFDPDFFPLNLIRHPESGFLTWRSSH